MTAGQGLLRILAVLAVIAAFIGALLGLARLFTPGYAKFTPRRLASSVIRETGGEAVGERPEPCRRIGTAWDCFVPAGSGSGGARYRVRMEDRHCWTAKKVVKETDGDELPEEAENCVRTDDIPD